MTERLISGWPNFSPTIREEVLTAIFSRRERLKPLMDSLQSGMISAAQISPSRKTTLLTQSFPALKELASKLFGADVLRPRQEVIAKYAAASSLKGDKVRGQKVFEANCMVCHRSGDNGNGVAPNYAAYEIKLKDASSFFGIIVSETAGSISLNPNSEVAAGVPACRGGRASRRPERTSGSLSGLEIFRRLDRSRADPPGGTPRSRMCGSRRGRQ